MQSYDKHPANATEVPDEDDDHQDVLRNQPQLSQKRMKELKQKLWNQSLKS